MAVEGGFQRQAMTRSMPASIWALTGLAVVAIWASVVLASIFAPDFVSGLQHDHLPLAWFDWIWGLAATASVVVAVTKGIRAGAFSLAPWVVLAVGTVVVWTGVVLVSALAPVVVTGSDPTTIPMAALGAPVLASFLTGFICTLVGSAFEPNQG